MISANANQCLSYKIKPKIIINTPNYNKRVVSSIAPMNLLHGDVVATLTTYYDIVTDIVPVSGGYCIAVKEIDALIGYTDFRVQIDGRHEKNSCSYNAILSHENRHIGAYLNVVDEYKNELHNSLYAAANSILPVFVKNENDINNTIEELNDELQSHPDMVLVLQKIHADEEIENKNIDIMEDYAEIKKCI
ncbi:MAG: hypothetical protein J6W79_00930 [Alphaproteobacteria bacterium]|nr:hypothetical protein [Alphaproteobacteria bacterium]